MTAQPLRRPTVSVVRVKAIKFGAFAVGAILVWLGLVGAGMAVLWRYANTPGEPAQAPARWPTQSAIVLHPDKLTLVMAVHPRCPCSRASIGELGVLMARTKGRVAAWVVFVSDARFSKQWTETDLRRRAAAIPGVRTLVDDGTHTHLFGAATSGQTLVYDHHGFLLFSGGITAARGHWGENAGLAAINNLALGASTSSSRQDGPVYGCPLFSKAAVTRSVSQACLK